MRSSKIRALIKLVEESSIDELEVSSWGRKVSIRKKAFANGSNNGNPGPQNPPARIEERLSSVEVTTQAPREQEIKSDLIEIKSPMVGTFYRAPAPDAKPYVEIGQSVKEGQVVCIIEAMKLMNEIESEMTGRVVEVLIENSKPVEFGQPLFLIDPE